MKCPNCGFEYMDTSRFCERCGTLVNPEVKLPKKRRKPWVVLVILFLVVNLAVSGAGYVFLFNSLTRDSETPWFRVINNVLHFYPEKYTGGPELTVPGTIAGKPVLYLSDGCFAGAENLTTVILPNGLKSIGDRAFAGCTALRGIFVPESVVLIGTDAFSNCSELEAICLTANLQVIGADAFAGCVDLRYVIYAGPYSSWAGLYPQGINPAVYIHCDDGIFLHGTTP